MNEKINKLLRHPATRPASVGLVVGVGVGVAATLAVQAYLDHRWVKSLGLLEDPELEEDLEALEADEMVENLEDAEALDASTNLADWAEGKMAKGPKIQQTVVSSTGRIYHRLVEPYAQEVEAPVVSDESESDSEPATEKYVHVNVFAQEDVDWDMEAEASARTPEEPYVIHVEEFFNDEMGFEQMALTYFAGDDVMVDERDVPIPNYKKVLGNNLRFGHGSRDESLVYIRNEKLRSEFEVVKDEGHYVHEILGVDDFKESGSSKVPKFEPEED